MNGRTAAVALCAVLALAGCGGGKVRLSKQEYARGVTAIYTELGARFRAAPAGGTFRETSASLSSIKRALDRATKRLRALEPPADAEKRHTTLVSATRTYAEQVDLLRASVDFGEPTTIAAHLREVTAPRLIQRTIRSLNASGYRIPVTVVALH